MMTSFAASYVSFLVYVTVLFLAFVPDTLCQAPYRSGSSSYGSGSLVAGGGPGGRYRAVDPGGRGRGYLASTGGGAASLGTIVSRVPGGQRSSVASPVVLARLGTGQLTNAQRQRLTSNTKSPTQFSRLRTTASSAGRVPVSPAASGEIAKLKLSRTEVKNLRQLVRFLSKSEAQSMRRMYGELGNSQQFRNYYNSLVLKVRTKYTLRGRPAPALPLWSSEPDGMVADQGVVKSSGRRVLGAQRAGSSRVRAQDGLVNTPGAVSDTQGRVIILTKPSANSPQGAAPRTQARLVTHRTRIVSPRQLVHQPAASPVNTRYNPTKSRSPTLTALRPSPRQSDKVVEPWRRQARRLPIEVQRRLRKVYDVTGYSRSFRELLNKALAKYLPDGRATLPASVSTSRHGYTQQQQRHQQQQLHQHQPQQHQRFPPPGPATIQQLQQEQLQEQRQRQQQALTGLVVASSLQGNANSDDENSGTKLGPLVATYLAAEAFTKPGKSKPSPTVQQHYVYQNNRPSAAAVPNGNLPTQNYPFIQNAQLQRQSSTVSDETLPNRNQPTQYIPLAPAQSTVTENRSPTVPVYQPQVPQHGEIPVRSGLDIRPTPLPVQHTTQLPPGVAKIIRIPLNGAPTQFQPKLQNNPTVASAASAHPPFTSQQSLSPFANPVRNYDTTVSVGAAPVQKMNPSNAGIPATTAAPFMHVAIPIPVNTGVSGNVVSEMLSTQPPVIPETNMAPAVDAVTITPPISRTINGSLNNSTPPPLMQGSSLIIDKLSTSQSPGGMDESAILSRMPSDVANNATLRQMFLAMASLARQKAMAAKANVPENTPPSFSVPTPTTTPPSQPPPSFKSQQPSHPSPVVIVIPSQMTSSSNGSVASLLSGGPDLLAMIQSKLQGLKNSSDQSRLLSPTTSAVTTTPSPTTTTTVPTTTTTPRKIALEPAITFSLSLPESSIQNDPSRDMRSLLQPMVTATVGKAETDKSKIDQFKTVLYDTLTTDPQSYITVSSSNRYQVHYKRKDEGPTVLMKELLRGYLTGTVDLASLPQNQALGLIPVVQFEWMFDEGTVPATATEAVDIVLAKYGRTTTTTTTTTTPTTTTTQDPTTTTSTTKMPAPSFQHQQGESGTTALPVMSAREQEATQQLIEILKNMVLAKQQADVTESPKSNTNDAKTTLMPLASRPTTPNPDNSHNTFSAERPTTILPDNSNMPVMMTLTNDKSNPPIPVVINTDNVGFPHNSVATLNHSTSAPMAARNIVTQAPTHQKIVVNSQTTHDLPNSTPDSLQVNNQQGSTSDLHQPMTTTGTLVSKANEDPRINENVANSLDVSSSTIAQTMESIVTTDPTVSSLDRVPAVTPPSLSSVPAVTPPSLSSVPGVTPPQDIIPDVAPPQDIIPAVAPPQDTILDVASLQDKILDVAPLQDTIPDVTPPQDTIPDVTPPQDSIPDVAPPQNKIPDVAPPQDKIPDVTPPQDTIPDVAPPQDKIPDVAPPQDKIPDVAPPQDKLPDVAPPLDTIPDVAPPQDKIPDVAPQQDKIPNVTPAQNSIPAVTAPSTSRVHAATPSVSRLHILTTPPQESVPAVETLPDTPSIQAKHGSNNRIDHSPPSTPTPITVHTNVRSTTPKLLPAKLSSLDRIFGLTSSGSPSTPLSGFFSTFFSSTAYPGIANKIGHQGGFSQLWNRVLGNSPPKGLASPIPVPKASLPREVSTVPVPPEMPSSGSASAPFQSAQRSDNRFDNSPPSSSIRIPTTIPPTLHLPAFVPQALNIGVSSGSDNSVLPPVQPSGFKPLVAEPVTVTPSAPVPSRPLAQTAKGIRPLLPREEALLTNVFENHHLQQSVHSTQQQNRNAGGDMTSSVLHEPKEKMLVRNELENNQQQPSLPSIPSQNLEPTGQKISSPPQDLSDYFQESSPGVIGSDMQQRTSHSPLQAKNQKIVSNLPASNVQSQMIGLVNPDIHPTTKDVMQNPEEQTSSQFDSNNVNLDGNSLLVDTQKQKSVAETIHLNLPSSSHLDSSSSSSQTVNNVVHPQLPQKVKNNVSKTNAQNPVMSQQMPTTPVPNFEDIDYYQFLAWLEDTFPNTTPPTTTTTTTPTPLSRCSANHRMKCGPIRKSSHRIVAMCEARCDKTIGRCMSSLCDCDCVATKAQLSLQLAPKRVPVTMTTTAHVERLATTKRSYDYGKEEEKESD